MSKFLVTGAGGFIGGYLVSHLLKQGHKVVCADIKPLEYWFQIFEENKNYVLDLKEYENCLQVTKDVDLFIIWRVIWKVWDLLKIIRQNVCFQF
jgi:GDP-D-mannose 3',5'-epimerase